MSESKVVIPDEAVEVAAMASAKDEDASTWHDEPDYYRTGWCNRMEVGLEAAAPLIASRALLDAADEYERILAIGRKPSRELTADEKAEWASFLEGGSGLDWLRTRATKTIGATK